ncbi:hypothetical protein HIM_01352 [Hirsutella minnesotensis 3608]|nr:hypothetical protein HIM_01352 [Hirsutella minnesotensis 3608]
MLERTAAGLESCSLQCLFPHTGRSIKSRRRLHTGFWQHGAAAIELAGVWTLPSPPPRPSVVDPSPGPAQPSLLATTFPLEFLYPNGTRALLSRLPPFRPQARDGHASGANVHRRCVISTSAASQKSNTPPQRIQDAEVGYSDHERALRRKRFEVSPKLVSLLSRGTRLAEQRGDEVWEHYTKLNRDGRALFRKPVALYLSKSNNPLERSQALSLFRRIPMEAWDNVSQEGVVSLLYRMGKVASGKRRYRIGLRKMKLEGGIRDVLMWLIEKHYWPLVLDIWLEYAATCSPKDLRSAMRNFKRLQLRCTPRLAMHYLGFERFLETHKSGLLHAVNVYSTSKRNLKYLRRLLAHESIKSLRRSRAYKTAAVILDLWKDSQFYELYLTQILGRLALGRESRGNLTMVADVYRKYRLLPRGKPSSFILRNMFEYFSSYDRRGVEEVYRDWHKAFGDLNQWGYEKYLDFYAQEGNIEAVRHLWGRYVRKYPEVLKLSSTFRLIIMTYAHAGDGAGAERVVRTMCERYDVMPDIDIWNALLKCYVLTEDDAGVARCLEDIKRMGRPDATTYSLLMTLAGRRGDLRAVLDHLQQSQEQNLSVDKDMAMALVTAYCRNDRLIAAENICTELSTRKKASTEMWNQVLVYYGVQGKLDKVHELVQAMNKHGIIWDARTYEALLQALIKVNQFVPAYKLLEKAWNNRIFHVSAEQFEIVVGGALRAGSHGLIDSMFIRMQRTNQPISFNTHVMVAEAAFRTSPTSNRAHDMARQLVGHLRAFLPTPRGSSTELGVPPRYYVGHVRELNRQTREVGRALSVMVELREFRAAEEMVNVYLELFPQYKDGAFPPKIAAPLMQGYLKDEEFGQVIAMWDRVFEDTLIRCRDPRTETLYPTHWYSLNAPLSVAVHAFRETGDGAGLAKCIDRLSAMDFKLTRSNWNLVISTLAELRQLERGMYWCERVLMPMWPGWDRRRLSLKDRRTFKNPRVLQPSRASVLALQMEWIKLRKLAAWSADVSKKLQNMEQNYPMLHHAFTTNEYEHLPAAWVMPKRPSLNEAITAMLRPLSYRDLLAMRKALEQQLRELKLQKVLRSVLSPFQAAQAKYRSQIITKAFSGRQLKQLEMELRKRLAKIPKRPDGGPTPASTNENISGSDDGGGSSEVDNEAVGKAIVSTVTSGQSNDGSSTAFAAGPRSSAGRRFASARFQRRTQSTLSPRFPSHARGTRRKPAK